MIPQDHNHSTLVTDGDVLPERDECALESAPRRCSRVRLIAGALVSLLPSFLKLLIYRHLYRYSIGRHVRIGFGTVIAGVSDCRIDPGVRIGMGNAFVDIAVLEIGQQTRIGHLNVIRGGQRVTLGEYVTILRGNVFNSGLLNDFVTPREPVLDLGRGTFVATGHWIDFTDRVTFGEQCIVGGRASSLWTHNRQRTRGISFGNQCYLGSDVRVAPGVEVASQCIVSLGAVLTGRFRVPQSMIAGNPAVVVRELNEQDLYHVTRKTRDDMPDDRPTDEVMSKAEGTAPAAIRPTTVAAPHRSTPVQVSD